MHHNAIEYHADAKTSRKRHTYLEPQTTIYKWLFQLDDSQSLHGKWLFHQTSIFNWLFGVPGTSSGFVSTQTQWIDLWLNRSCERHTTRSVACCSMQRCLLEGLWSGVLLNKYRHTHKEYIVFQACSMFSSIVFHGFCYSFSSMLCDCLSPQLLLAPFFAFSKPQLSFFHEASCRTSHPLQNRVSGCLKIGPWWNRQGA